MKNKDDNEKKKIPSAALRWVNPTPQTPSTKTEVHSNQSFSWQEIKRQVGKESPSIDSHLDRYADKAASLAHRLGHK